MDIRPWEVGLLISLLWGLPGLLLLFEVVLAKRDEGESEKSSSDAPPSFRVLIPAHDEGEGLGPVLEKLISRLPAPEAVLVVALVLVIPIIITRVGRTANGVALKAQRISAIKCSHVAITNAAQSKAIGLHESADCPGTTAGPESPPFNNPCRLSRRSPPKGVEVLEL